MPKINMMFKINQILSVGLLAIVAILLSVILSPSVSAAADTCTWTGGGSDNKFSTAANWTGCDNGHVPESGDALAFDLSSLTSEASSGEVVNDLTGYTFDGLSETGTRPTGVSTYYKISGEDFSLSGDVNFDSVRYLNLSEINVTAVSDISISGVSASYDSSLSIGNNDVELIDSSFKNYSGSGKLIFNVTLSGAGGGGCFFGDIVQSSDNSDFSGSIELRGSASIRVNGDSKNLGNRASLITVNSSTAYLIFEMGYEKNLTFEGDITFNGGWFRAIQYSKPSICQEPSTKTTLKLTGKIKATAPVKVYPKSANVVIDGDITGGDKFKIADGISNPGTLTVGGTAQESQQVTEEASDDKPEEQLSVHGNKVVILDGVRGDVFVGGGGILKGNGKITDDLSVGRDGTVAPGHDTGCLTVGRDLYLNGEYQFEVAGNDACKKYDQIIVGGAIKINSRNEDSPTLKLLRSKSFVPKKGDKFILIKNNGDEAVAGEFEGMSEGDDFEVDGVTYRISYKGGDGNDVEVAVLGVSKTASVPDTGFEQLINNVNLVIGSSVLLGAFLIASRKFAKN